MQTIAEMGKKRARTPALQTTDVRQLDIGLIDPSKTNPRKDFGDLAGLAASIEQQGILEPLIVRPKGKRFEIVAGERRFRAAKLANLTALFSIVRNLSDADAIEIQGIENIQRQNLKPLEEAAQYRLLIDTKPDKFSAEAIGKRQGKSASWVWDYMKMLDLVPEAKKLLDEGRISVNHAIPIARLTPAQQRKIIDPDGNALFRNERHTLQFDGDEEERRDDKYSDVAPVSVKELQAYIAEHIRFNPKQAAAAAPLLFDNVAQQVSEAEKKPGRGKKVIAITHNYRTDEDARDPNERTFGGQSWKRADGKFDSKKCERSVLGVVVAGRGYGEAFDVCVARDKCTVHWAAEVNAKEKREGKKLLSASGASKSAGVKAVDTKAEEKKRAAAELETKIDELADELIRKAAEKRLAKLPKKLPKKLFDRVLEAAKDEISSHSFYQAKGITQDNFVQTLAVCRVKDDLKNCYEEDEWAETLGVDVKKLRAQAKAQVEVQVSGETKTTTKKATKKARKK